MTNKIAFTYEQSNPACSPPLKQSWDPRKEVLLIRFRHTGFQIWKNRILCHLDPKIIFPNYFPTPSQNGRMDPKIIFPLPNPQADVFFFCPSSCISILPISLTSGRVGTPRGPAATTASSKVAGRWCIRVCIPLAHRSFNI